MSGTAHMFFKILAVMAVVVVGTVMAQDVEITRSTFNGGEVTSTLGGGSELFGTWCSQTAHTRPADAGGW